MQAKIKAYELRGNNKASMLKKLEELKQELGAVRLPVRRGICSFFDSYFVGCCSFG